MTTLSGMAMRNSTRSRRSEYVNRTANAAWKDGIDTRPCVFAMSMTFNDPSRSNAKSDTLAARLGSATLKWMNALVAGKGVEINRR